jgi:hypothetical protein
MNGVFGIYDEFGRFRLSITRDTLAIQTPDTLYRLTLKRDSHATG